MYRDFVRWNEKDVARAEDVAGDNFKMEFTFDRERIVVTDRKEAVPHLAAGLRIGAISSRNIGKFGGFDFKATPDGVKMMFEDSGLHSDIKSDPSANELGPGHHSVDVGGGSRPSCPPRADARDAGQVRGGDGRAARPEIHQFPARESAGDN